MRVLTLYHNVVILWLPQLKCIPIKKKRKKKEGRLFFPMEVRAAISPYEEYGLAMPLLEEYGVAMPLLEKCAVVVPPAEKCKVAMPSL